MPHRQSPCAPDMLRPLPPSHVAARRALSGAALRARLTRSDVEFLIGQIKPPRYRLLMKLRYLEHHSNKETAKLLGMTMKNYYNKHKLAKDQLARIMEKASCWLVTGKENRQLAEEMHFRWAESADSALKEATELLGEKSTITVIPDGVKIGKNTAVWGVTEPADYPDGQLQSGDAIVKAGGLK